MKKHREDGFTITQSMSDGLSKQEFIEKSHEFREKFLYALELGNQELVKQLLQNMDEIIKDDSIDLFKRIPENKLRSYKNFLLSHNTLYGYTAEKGGLSALQSHYITEKYAILIENTDTTNQLDQLHLQMLIEYSDPSIRFKKKGNTTITEKAMQYMAMNFTEDISVDEIAQNIHVHPSHLMRLFRKEKGMTISQFHRNLRMEEAKILLSQSNLSITDISFMVGYNNPQYFCRIFKQEFSITPKEYKRSNPK